jgi:hypothetical protein
VHSGGRIFLGLNLLIVVGLLRYHYNNAETPGAQAKIRLVALGGGISALSIVIFTILPDGLFHQPILPYRYTFLLLALIPLTYGYAIFRYHLIEIEEHVNRGATSFLIYSVIGGAYLVFYFLLSRVLPREVGAFPLINALIVLLLVSLFTPLRSRVQRFVDRVFYGYWYDYREGVLAITQGLDEISELQPLAQTVSERLVRTLNLEESCAFLRGLDGRFSIIEVYSRASLAARPPRVYPVLPRSSLTYLLKIGAVERDQLRKALAEITVTPEELGCSTASKSTCGCPSWGASKSWGCWRWVPSWAGMSSAKTTWISCACWCGSWDQSLKS